MRPLLLAAASLGLAAAAPPPVIPGPDDGGWDYARVDPATGMLYVARGSSVSGFDLHGKSPPRSIGHIAHGHAVLPVPGTHDLLVTSGGDDSVRLIDSRDGRERARLAVGSNPDGAAIDPVRHRAYVMNAKSGTVSVIDLVADTIVTTIPLGPGLEFPALAKDGTLFVNNEDAGEMETIDTRTLKAGAPVPLPGCIAPSGLAYDAKTDRLIAACDNGKAAVVDARARRLTSLLPIGDGPDAVILDAPRRRAYIPGGKSGDLTLIALDGNAGPHVTGRVVTEAYARTGALDPRDGSVYLPTARLAPPAPGAKRGAPLPGTFHLVAVRP